jgi:hypothetical protein
VTFPVVDFFLQLGHEFFCTIIIRSISSYFCGTRFACLGALEIMVEQIFTRAARVTCATNESQINGGFAEI